MNRWIACVEEVLSWTAFASLVLANRPLRQARLAAEFYDRQRIDRLLSEIVQQHGDLLG